MDETQRLDFDEEEEPSVQRDTPVGNLHMFAGLHGPAQDFPIYRGQNLIGRHASCDITLPAQSVSKKHAILEVRGDCHTICDNGSLNKTRRGKAALSPHVRYSLSGGDFLLFADVACRYTIEENIEIDTTGVEESEDDSVLVPATQGALAIEKTPGAAIRRIARGTVLARDSGDEDEEEQGQTRRNEGGCGSLKESHKTSSTGAIFQPDADTIVPESDEEIDTSTSESRLPSLYLPSDSDTDTSRRSSFVPSSQNISTPVVLKEPSRLDERTLTAVVKEETESGKRTDTKMKVEDPTDSKENQKEEQTAESTSSGSVSEPCLELVGTADDKVKKEQDDSLKKPSSESSPCDKENVTSSRSETVQEVPCESDPKGDALVQNNNVKISDTDIKVKEDVRLDGESNIQQKDATTAGIDVTTAETSEIQSNKAEEKGNEGALGPRGAAFHMDSDTDVDEDEAATTGSDLEKVESHKVAEIKESENSAKVSLTGGNEDGSDSDTDVEDDPNVLKSKDDDKVNKMGEPSKTEGPAVLGIDSDTDDDEDIPKPAENKAEQDSTSNVEEKKEDLHLDSDTDVEEDTTTAEVKEAEPESSKETKDTFNLDSDTDVEEDADVSSRDMTHGPQDSSTASTNIQEATGVDTDTDVDNHVDVEPKDKTALSDALVAKEATALPVDSDTDVDDDEVPPESTTHTDGAKMATEVTAAAELHLDSDTDVEESDGDKSEVDTTDVKEEASVEQKPSVSSTSEAVPTPGTSEQTKNIPTEIGTEDDETQKSESESVDLDMMPTQCYLEPQEASELQDEEEEEEEEEEATQAFIFSSTWAEPDPFKRPADPIGVLQISSVTLNASEEEIDENAIAETQDFCTDAEPIGPSVQDTPEPVNLDETIQSSSGGEESGLEIQQSSMDATEPVSEDLSARSPQEAGTWLHLKREVPASVWIRGIQQEGDTTDLEGGKETAEDATQADEQSLKLELEATQSYIEESPKPLVQTEASAVPAADQSNTEAKIPSKDIDQPCSEDTRASENDATQAYTLAVPESGATQASNVSEEPIGDAATEDDNTQVLKPDDGATPAESMHRAATEGDDTQVVTPDDGATQAESRSTVAAEEDNTQVVTPDDGATQAESMPKDATEDDTQVVTVGDGVSEAESIHTIAAKDDTLDDGATQAESMPTVAAEDDTQVVSLDDGATQVESMPTVAGEDDTQVVTPGDGATQAERIHAVAGEDDTQVVTPDDGATQAENIHTVAAEDDNTQVVTPDDGATQAENIHTVSAEDDNTQVLTPSIPAAEEVMPETSTKSKEKPSSRRGLSRSKKKEEPAQNVPISSKSEEPLDKASPGPGSLKEEPEEQSAGKPQLSEPEIKEVKTSEGPGSLREEPDEKRTEEPQLSEPAVKEVRRRGGRRIAESQTKTTAKEELPAATTSRKRTSKTVEAEPSEVIEQRGRKQISRKSSKVANEELKEEHEQPSSKTEEVKESSVPNILPVDPPEEIKTLEDDKKGNAGEHTSKESTNETSLKNKDILRKEASTSSTLTESEERMEANDDSAEKELDSRQNKKPTRNKRQVATRLKNEAESSYVEKSKDENIEDHNLETSQQKDTGKEKSESQQITQEESQGRKATRKSRAKPSEQESDKSKDTAVVASKKAEEVSPAEQVPENEKSRRTRRSLREEVKEESENVQEGRRKPRKSANDEEPKNEEKGNEDVPESNIRSRRTRNNSKEDTTKPEQKVKEDVKVEENEVIKKPKRAQKNLKEEQKPEDNVEMQEISSSDSQLSRRTSKTVKEETVKETTSRRTRRQSKEDEPVKLDEEQPKKSRRTRKDSKEEEPVKLVEEQPKKSGRPRKASREEEPVKLDEQPKKSGRPRKDSKEEEPVKLDEEQPKKSGRVRKASREEEPVKLDEQPKRSRRTRKDSKEEEPVKLDEEKTKRSGRAKKDSKEESKTEESFVEEDKEETVGRKSTQKARRNLKNDESGVHENEPKQTEDNSKSERSSRTRAKKSDESRESQEEIEGENKGAEESHKLSPHEETSKPTGGRGRRAAKKEDIPQVSTPAASRKRGQAAKAEVEEKKKKTDEGEEQEELGEVETPKSRRGRPRKRDTENTQKEVSPPDPSPSPSIRKRPSSALSNPSEARTPRRTNRLSASATATSPHVTQSGSAPKILFTGVVDTAGEETIRALGGEIAESVFDCTHLVTDRVRRTVKFLCALARGIPIVTLDWIEKCKKSGCFLSPTGFLVNDKEQEKNFNFLLSESLQKAKKSPLFEGYHIHVTANVKPEPENMKDIISCSGATFLPKMPRSFKEKCVIVSCPEDAARCKSVPASVPITSAEFILSGILRQEVNPTAYLLKAADAVPTPAKRRR